MKKGFIGLLILALCAFVQFAYGATAVSGRPCPGGAAAASPCTGASPADCTLREVFDGSSYCYGSSGDQNCSFTWTNYDTAPDWNYSAAPLQGTYSAEMGGASVAFWKDVTGASEYYVAFMFNIHNVTDDTSPVQFRDSGGNILCQTYIGSGAIGARQAGGTNSTTIAISLDTTYYVKLRGKAGSGANAECQIYLSTNGTTWTSTQTSTDGTWTANIEKLVFQGRASVTPEVVDDIRLYTGDISW